MSKLQQAYQNNIAKELQKRLKIANVHQVPRIEKVVLNVGVGRASGDSRALETATNTLRKISGQNPVITKAHTSIAGFKLREGQPIGAKVTLRGRNMYEFIDRLISVVLPRMRDFRGLSTKAFDPQGNYSIGLRDQSVFPELSYEETTFLHGLQINIVTNSDPELSRELLSDLGFPFEKEDKRAV